MNLSVHTTYALSFYRSQNVFGWSKFFSPDQKFIYILWQSQTFCARQKDDLHSVKKNFCAGTKVFEKALNAVKFLGWLKKFGPAQNILGPVKGQGITVFDMKVTIFHVKKTCQQKCGVEQLNTAFVLILFCLKI